MSEVFSFDHDLENWVSVGPGRVSADGAVVVSDPGFGIMKSGWGYRPPPPPPKKCVDACGPCKTCVLSFCVPNPLARGTPCSLTDPCEVNGRCTLFGTCSGDKKEITSVDAKGDGKSEIAKCVNQQVAFTVTATQKNCSNLQYKWDFGDGASSTEQNPKHTYTVPGDYKATVTVKCDNCAQAQKQAQVRVGVIKIEQSDDLWWFGGETPANYKVEVKLTASGITKGTFKWDITGGADKVSFGNGASSFTAVNDNKATLRGRAPSAPAATVTKDITIKLTVDGNPTCDFQTVVFAPRRLIHLRDVDNVDATFAYSSEVHYRIEDQFNRTLPSNVELNEHFTTGQVADFAGMNWRRGPEGGATVAPADWLDQIQGETPAHVPVPQNPQAPLGNVAVSHWDGEWNIGSTAIGRARRVQTNRWQKFRDHARHTNIASPP